MSVFANLPEVGTRGEPSLQDKCRNETIRQPVVQKHHQRLASSKRQTDFVEDELRRAANAPCQYSHHTVRRQQIAL